MISPITTVSFKPDGTPMPRYIAVGTAGEHCARTLRFRLPQLTPDQHVYVSVQKGDRTDVVRLYQGDDGLWDWTLSGALLSAKGGGWAQLKLIDAADPLDIRWLSGRLELSVAAAMDADAIASETNLTMIDQLQIDLQEAEARFSAYADEAEAAINSAQALADAAKQSAYDARGSADTALATATAMQEAAAAQTERIQTYAAYADAAQASAYESQQAAQAAADEAAAVAVGDIDTRYVHRLDYTGREILRRLSPLDGVGSGLDSDRLDGRDGSFYRNASNIDAGLLAIQHGGTGLVGAPQGSLLEGGGMGEAYRLRPIADSEPETGSSAIATSGQVCAALAAKADRPLSLNATLSAAGWDNGFQRVEWDEIKTGAALRIGLSAGISSAALRAAAYARLRVISQSAGALIVTYDGAQPTVDIPVTVISEGQTGTAAAAQVSAYTALTESNAESITTLQNDLNDALSTVSQTASALSQLSDSVDSRFDGDADSYFFGWHSGMLRLTSSRPTAYADVKRQYTDEFDVERRCCIYASGGYTLRVVVYREQDGAYVIDHSDTAFVGGRIRLEPGHYQLIARRGSDDISGVDLNDYVDMRAETMLSGDALCCRGSAVSTGAASFDDISRPGIYAFEAADVVDMPGSGESGTLAVITGDVPDDLNQGGALIVYYAGAGDTRVQLIRGLDGAEWIRTGGAAFVRADRDEMKYRGSLTGLGYTSFSEAERTGYYSFTGASLRKTDPDTGLVVPAFDDIPDGLSSAGVLITLNKTGAGSDDRYSRMQIVRDSAGSEWFRPLTYRRVSVGGQTVAELRPFTQTIDMGTPLFVYRGKVSAQPAVTVTDSDGAREVTGFLCCGELGYYSFSTSEARTFYDAPKGLSAGILIVFNRAASSQRFQLLIDINGDRYFRYGEHEFTLDRTPLGRLNWLMLGDSVAQGYHSYVTPVLDGDGVPVYQDGAPVMRAHTSLSGSMTTWPLAVERLTGHALTNLAQFGAGFVSTRRTSGQTVGDTPNGMQRLFHITTGSTDPEADDYNPDYVDMADYGLVTLMFGINDWNSLCPLGDMNDAVPPLPDDPEYDHQTYVEETTTTSSGQTYTTRTLRPYEETGTVVGNLRAMIEWLMKLNPALKLTVLLPLNACLPSPGLGTAAAAATDWDAGLSNGRATAPYTLSELAEAIRTVCQYYGVECIDLLHGSVINRCNTDRLLPDGVHPSEQAHLLLGRDIAAKLCK